MSLQGTLTAWGIAKRLMARPRDLRADDEIYERTLTRLLSPDGGKLESTPVFLASAGWRSGSTLLQRLLCSDPRCIVWGEPLYRASVLPRLVRLVEAMSQYETYDTHEMAPQEFASDRWLAEASPPLTAMGDALRQFLISMFAKPTAADAGATAPLWGVKEVRWGFRELRLLDTLLPGARFVLLVRNPMDAYESFIQHYPNVWYREYPDAPVATPLAFGRHWASIGRDFLRLRDRPNYVLVRYEDVISDPTSFASLMDSHLGIQIETSVLDLRLTGLGHQKRIRHRTPSAPARWIVRRVTAVPARELGYEV